MLKSFLILTLLGLLGLAGLWFWLPDPSGLQRETPKVTAFIEQKCRGKYCRYRWVPLSEISRFVSQAVIVAEDYRFHVHKGLDWASLKDALKQNLKEGRIVWGASSITMQLAKNLYLTPEKTFWRKFKEMILALKLERALTKNRILELYLNFAEWGPNLFGITAASEHYFNKSPSEIDANEAAFLAALLPNPQQVGTPKWFERVAQRGQLIFALLLDHYLPPYRKLPPRAACKMRLNQSESVQVGQIVNKLFLNLAPQILVGEADALSRKGLQALLSDSEIETVNRLSNQVASLKQTSSHACQRSAATNQAKLRPLPQAIPVLGKKTVLVPRSTHAPLTNLLQQAAKAGIDLHVRSAYRNDGFQIFLLLAMLRQNRFCVSSLVDQVALPDENEHSCLDHPAFDLWSSQMEEVTFERSQAFEWLQDNGPAFGFRQTYPEKNRRGFLPKPWHWQYAGIPLN